MLNALCALAVWASFLAGQTAPVPSQSGGVLTGVVKDASGAVLPGATITLTAPALASPRSVVTDDQGRYRLENLPAGRYSVEAALSGFQPRTTSIGLDAATALDIALEVSSLVERVTVTATKMGSADIQSTPIAMTAIPAKSIQEMGAQTVEGLTGVVPALTVTQNTGLGQVTIRGVGTNFILAGADPSSTVHLDGVYLARPAMVFTDFLDVERVEVLRGPQGTLFGRNSVGGTVNIVTRQPTNALETRARLTAGRFDTLRAEAAISGPLVRDKVMGSVAFLRGTRDGFVKDLNHPDNPLGGEDTWVGHGQIRVVFGARSELLLSGDSGRFDGVPLTNAKPIAAKPGFTFDNPASPWEVRASHEASGSNIQRGASARLLVPVSGTTTLSSLTAYRASNYHYFIDADATELTRQTVDARDVQHQVSEELTLFGRTSKLGWIVGAFFFDETTKGPVEITVFPAGTQNRPSPTIGSTARALFGQATYELSRRLSLTAGARYTDESKDLENTGGVYALGTAFLAVPSSFYAFVDRATFNAWTPKVGLQFQWSPASFAYLSASRGFKSGGFNPSWPEPGNPFNPEFAWSYEGGLKRVMSDGRIRVNTAAFYNDYRDLQVQAFIRPGLFDVSNAASATIMGIETEAVASVGHGAQFSGHVSWLDATYDRYLAVDAGGQTIDVAGNRLNNAPVLSGRVSAIYEFATGGAGTASIRADVSAQSRVFFTRLNDDSETERPYGLVNLRAGFEPRGRRWEVAVYARNMGNTAYVTGTSNTPIPTYSGRPGEPRTWGTQLTLRR